MVRYRAAKDFGLRIQVAKNGRVRQTAHLLLGAPFFPIRWSGKVAIVPR